MPIQSGQSVDILIGSGDTTILNPTQGRVLITSASGHEQTGAAETVEFFISANSASAAGERIERASFAANETISLAALRRGIPSGYYLIGNAGTGNLVMVSLTYQQYSGSS